MFKSNLVIKNELENIISNYFIEILNYFKDILIIEEHGNKNNWKKLISDININLINEKIKNDKCILWENIRSVIFKYSDIVCDTIIKNVLKLDLLELKEKHNFSFSIITGIGRFKKNKGFIVENGEYISLDTINLIYSKYIKDKKCRIERNKEKESIYQSTLFLTIFTDTLPIINLEVRYKGRFHTSPDVLAFFTKEFKDLLLGV
jgi:hypothetical protein